jgi:hypothetical protein
MNSLRIVASGNQKCRGGIYAHAMELSQLWSRLQGQCIQIVAELFNLFSQP